MALVVFVFTSILMLAQGLQTTLVETGSHDNVIAIRKGSGTEVQSGIDRLQASILETVPEVATGPEGQSLVAKEVVVLITLPKRGSNKPSNVMIRGVSLPLWLCGRRCGSCKGACRDRARRRSWPGRAWQGDSRAAAWARRFASACATGRWWGFSMQATPDSAPRSGVTSTS